MAYNFTSNTTADFNGLTPGRVDLVNVSGTFDSATVTPQTQDNGTDWVDYPSSALTSAGANVIVVPTDTVRIAVTGGGGSLDLDVVVQELRD